jgi:hypothetical protein
MCHIQCQATSTHRLCCQTCVLHCLGLDDTYSTVGTRNCLQEVVTEECKYTGSCTLSYCNQPGFSNSGYNRQSTACTGAACKDMVQPKTTCTALQLLVAAIHRHLTSHTLAQQAHYRGKKECRTSAQPVGFSVSAACMSHRCVKLQTAPIWC